MIDFRKNKVKISLLVILFSTFLSVFGVSGETFATVESTDSLQKIAILQGAKRCYREYLKSEIEYGDFTQWSSVFNTGGNWGSKDDWVLLPTNVGNTIKDKGLTCSETFNGYSGGGGSSTGVKSYYTIPNTLNGMGYYFDHNNAPDDPDSAQMTITLNSIKDETGANSIPTTITDNTITISGTREFVKGGWFSSDHYEWDLEIVGKLGASYEGKNIFSIEYSSGSNYPFLNYDTSSISLSWLPENLESLTWSPTGDTITDATGKLVEAIKTDFIAAFAQYGSTPDSVGGVYSNPKVDMTVKTVSTTSTDEKNVKSVYKPVGGQSAAEVMLANMNIGGVPVLNGELHADGQSVHTASAWWDANHIYSLYYNYLLNAAKEHSGIKIGPCSTERPSEAAYAFKGTKDNWCIINIPPAEQSVLNEYVATVGSIYLQEGKFEDILTWFNNESSYQYMDEDKYANVDAKDPEPVPTDPEHPDNPDGGEKSESEKLEEACYRQAKSLGWIICPMVFGLEEVSKGIYQQVEPMIRVNDTVISQIQQGNSGGGEMFKAWNTFRGIANIIFVILFLFIIFSQLTGFGIDNYGIKKMLPKVIVTAILVNISFLICAVAVDISNILGKALQDLFIAIAPSSSVLSATSPVDGTIEIIVNVVAVIAIAGTSGIVIGTILMNGWAIIIPILLFLLVMVISIIFALIVLGLRQAFVVILVIVSPIAFACTLLPNTEAVFRKWKDFFKQILMVYPIVGGLIGAGYFVARMIYTSNADLIMSITAGILCVAPYFLVPSLTRKSLAMAGNIGERLRGLGQNAGRRVQNLNNTEAVRGIRGRSRDNALTRRGIDKLSMKAANWANGEGKGTKRAWLANHTIASRGRMASIARTNQNRVANSRETAYGQAANAVAERQRLESGGYDARNASIAGDSFSKAVKDYESLITNGEYVGADGNTIGQNDIKALETELVNELTKENADDVKINALTNKLLGNGKKGLRKVDSAYSKALESGKVSSSAIKAFSNNIKNSHPEIADMMPSLFESSLVGAPSGSLGGRAYEQFNNEGIGSLNAAKMAKLDKTQLDKYLNSDGSGFADYMNESSRQQLASLASQALNDDRIAGDISVDNRSRLEAIAKAGGQPVPNVSKLEGDSGKIHQTPSTSTPSATQTVTPPAQTEAARSAGANTATVRATQISDATRARAAEQGRVNPEVERAIDQANKGGGRQTDSGIWLPS